MKLPSIPFVVLDTETTGFIPRVNRVIEFASVTVRDGKVGDEYEQLISIDSDVPEVVQVLTHIRPDDLEGKPTFEEALNRDEAVAAILTPEDIASALEPGGYLGSATTVVDGVLARAGLALS